MKKFFLSLMMSALFFSLAADTIPTYVEGFIASKSNLVGRFYSAAADANPFATHKSSKYGFHNETATATDPDRRHAIMVFKTDGLTEDALGTQLKLYVDPTPASWTPDVKGGLAYIYYHEDLPLDELNASATAPTWTNLHGTNPWAYSELLDSVNLGLYNNNVLSPAITAKLNECRAEGKDLYLVWVSALPGTSGRTSFAWNTDSLNASKLITIKDASASMSLGGNGNIWNGAESSLSFSFLGKAPYSVTYKANDTEVTLDGLLGDTLISIMPTDTTDYHLVSATDMDGAMNLLSTDTFAVTVKHQAINIGPEFAVYDNDSLDIFVDATGQWPFEVELSTGLQLTLDTANADSRHINRIALRLAKADVNGQNISVVSASDKYGAAITCDDVIQTASISDGTSVTPVYDSYIKNGDAEEADHSTEDKIYCKHATVGYREAFIQFAKADLPAEAIEKAYLVLNYNYSYHIDHDLDKVSHTRNDIYGVDILLDVPFTPEFMLNYTSYPTFIDTTSYKEDGEFVTPLASNTALSYAKLYYDVTDYVADAKASDKNTFMLMAQQDEAFKAIYQGFSSLEDTIPANRPMLLVNPTVDMGETAINESRAQDLISIYPNPANDVLNVVGENVGLVRIYSLAGKRVLEAQPINGRIDVSSIKAGAYIIQAQVSGAITSKMLIIE